MKARGFTLLECLLGMAFLLLLTTAALEFHVSAQKRFFRLKQFDADAQAIAAALNTIRIDVGKSGKGLAPAAALGLISPVSLENGGIGIRFSEKAFRPAGALAAGQTRLALEPKPSFAAGRRICVVSEAGGEIHTVSSVEAGTVVLAAPLETAHPAETAQIALIELIFYYMDKDGKTLRRRVNAGTSQPLMEEAAVFQAGFDPDVNLVRIEIAGISKPENSHVILIFPKNTAPIHRTST